MVCIDGFLYTLEECFARVETPCSESVDGSICYVFGQIDEDEHLSYPRVDQLKGGLDSLVLHSHHGIVLPRLIRDLDTLG